MILSDYDVLRIVGNEVLVLILVLMDDTLWLPTCKALSQQGESLNPCFNGWYSLTFAKSTWAKSEQSLNPCFNGWYSLTVLNCVYGARW